MKKVVLCLFFLFFVSFVFGQANLKLDSLKRVLAKLPAEGKAFASDTIRVRVLCDIGEVYRKVKNDSILIFVNKALGISNKIKFESGLMRSNMILGKYYSFQALSIKSSEFFLKALVIAEKMNDIDNQKELLLEIGIGYSYLGDFETALKYFNKNLALCKRYGSTEDYLLGFNNIGILYFEQKNYSKALFWFSLFEEKSKVINNTKLLNVALINIAKIYSETGKYKEALERLEKSLLIDEGYKDKISFVSNEIANIYLKQNRLNLALKKARLAFENTNLINKEEYKNICQTLSKIYEKKGDSSNAFYFYKLFAEINLNQDSLKNSQMVRFMNLDYQNGKQIQQIEGLNSILKQKETQTKMMFSGAMLALTITLVSLISYRTIKNKNRQIEVQKMEILDLNQNLEKKIEERTEELSLVNKELVLKNFEITEALFKGQTLERKRLAAELHDNLGSTLSALKWRLEALNSNNLNDKEKAIYKSIQIMMSNAYKDVRNISHNLLPTEFETKGLVAALEKYIGDLNENSKIKFTFKTRGDLSEIDKKVALELYSISMELINNILKHSRATKAEILLEKSDEKLSLDIKDNGIGLSRNNIEGKGKTLIRERVTTLGGEFEVLNLKYWNTALRLKI